MLLNCGVREDSSKSLGLQGDPTSPSQRKSVLNIHWKEWCWSWSFNNLATWCKELTHWKRPWCWERLKVGGEGDDRGWDGWMESLYSCLSWSISSVTQLCLTLRPHGLQHARPPCPSPTLEACSNSCPLSWWCHPTISSSVVPFFSCLKSFPASGSFLMSSLHQVAKVLKLQLQHQSFQWIFRTDSL